MIRFRYWEGTGRCFEMNGTFEEFQALAEEYGCWGGPLPRTHRQPDKNQYGYQYRPNAQGEYEWQEFVDEKGWTKIEGGLAKVTEVYSGLLQ